MKNETKKGIMHCDIMVIITILMVLGIHMITNFYMEFKSRETQATIESTIKYYESNIFLNVKLLTDKLLTLVFMLIKPGIVMGLYWIFRNRVKNNKTDILELKAYVLVLFFSLLTNFLNDFSVLAGLLAKTYMGG